MLLMALPNVDISAVHLFAVLVLIYSPDGTSVYGSRVGVFEGSGLV